MKRGTRLLVTCTAILVLVLGWPAAAFASTPSCGLPDTSHCYAILRGTGTTFYGMYSTWNRANMTAPSSQANPEFVDSEMWFSPACSSYPWVEMGLAYGYEGQIGTVAYYAFYAWKTVGGIYDIAFIASLVVNGAVTDEYQMSSPTPDGAWNIYWDGNHYMTPPLGFTSGACVQQGAEVATSNGCAKTFDMYSQAYNSAGQRVNWGAQTSVFIPTWIAGTELNGISYQNSEWSWNTVNSSGC
jgi:hypothetical protein